MLCGQPLQPFGTGKLVFNTIATNGLLYNYWVTVLGEGLQKP